MSGVNSGGDTIAAVSTPPGPGGIAIVRISGPEAGGIVDAVFRSAAPMQSHMMRFGHIVDPKGRVVDEALVCFMQGPRSYTREDVAEINCHGGRAAVQAVLGLALENGARMAQPGEFTKRAFLNGRIDLTRAEAVKDIILSETEQARQAAAAQLAGGLARRVETLADALLSLLARIEASIDYPEHEMEHENMSDAATECGRLLDELDKLIDGAAQGIILREGVETAIVGRPNVGKSSLMNALAGCERAIVTDIPGTTRDALRELVDVGGVALRLSDTAGIRDTADVIERIGVQTARQAAGSAQLALFVADGSLELTQDDLDILEMLRGKRFIAVLNKSDLARRVTPKELCELAAPEAVVVMSLATGAGLDTLRDTIREMFGAGELGVNGQEIVYSMRHRQALVRCRDSVRNALDTVEAGLGEDFVAIDLRAAYEALGEVTGATLDEDVIDRIFSEFCLGK